MRQENYIVKGINNKNSENKNKNSIFDNKSNNKKFLSLNTIDNLSLIHISEPT